MESFARSRIVAETEGPRRAYVKIEIRELATGDQGGQGAEGLPPGCFVAYGGGRLLGWCSFGGAQGCGPRLSAGAGFPECRIFPGPHESRVRRALLKAALSGMALAPAPASGKGLRLPSAESAVPEAAGRAPRRKIRMVRS